MSLREIRGHNRFEIMTMLASLNRWNILQEGQGITDDMRRGPQGAQCSKLHNAYLDEVEKYKLQFKVKNAFDDDSDKSSDK
jgi:hypothetical protein